VATLRMTKPRMRSPLTTRARGLALTLTSASESEKDVRTTEDLMSRIFYDSVHTTQAIEWGHE
jgi:hypothetical protein